MKFVVYENEDFAISKVKYINQTCLKTKWENTLTTNYADIIKHYSLDIWALPIIDEYEQFFSAEEIEQSITLTEDWFPPIVVIP